MLLFLDGIEVEQAYHDDGDDGRNYRIEGSYARGRQNARRDSMGRYSRDDGMIRELRELMEEAPDERTKMEFERFIRKMESM